ncbi:MAG: glycosyltransferase [Lentisphaeria bacterium]|nr:glycosyltransferase [Lentisphaeria bacterium]
MREFDVNKYRRKNPAPELPEKKHFRHAVVIPVYNELASFGAAEHSIRQALAQVGENIAVIAVINYPAGQSEEESEKLLNLIRAGVFPGVTPLYLPELYGGVGAARKAGMDAFIRTLEPDEMEKSVIFSLDADTVIEKEYFAEVLPETLKGGAVSIGFSHQKAADEAHQQAIDRYEAYLKRYVDKLKEANSPYAFFTVGSAFAVRCDAYLKAGGMKVREAGEDFYFLQAVAKTSGVRSMDRVLVHPSPRISLRVPFGTGQAVAKFLRGGELNEIPDGAFALLKKVLENATEDKLVSAEKFLSGLPVQAAEFFLKERFVPAWGKIMENLPERPGARITAFNGWFDGLKTLRFLHFSADFFKKQTKKG